MLAASTTTQDTQALDRFPETLWGWVEQLLIKHHDRRGGGFGMGGTASVTAALMERGGAQSIASPCSRCNDGLVPAPRCTKRVPCGLGSCERCNKQLRRTPGKLRRGMVLIDCEWCFGSGQILHLRDPAPSTVSQACTTCNGAGRYHPRRRRWARMRSDELAWCIACKGEGFTIEHVAAPTQGSWDMGCALEIASQSWIAPTLQTLDRDDPRSALVLDMLYGDVGREVWRRGQRRLVALWPLTKDGQRLAALAKRQHRRVVDTIIDELDLLNDDYNDVRAARVRRAEDSVLAMHAWAKLALWKADQKAGFRVYRAAKALERKATGRAA